uniref:Uncharacterized protein n=1 Tax=Myotis myotis TaxID=51298 RepID=A0A7J7XHA3_MYOMY|nr:hypothetical protein mMyoMyo1_011592 [Myotis myotis]
MREGPKPSALHPCPPAGRTQASPAAPALRPPGEKASPRRQPPGAALPAAAAADGQTPRPTGPWREGGMRANPPPGSLHTHADCGHTKHTPASASQTQGGEAGWQGRWFKIAATASIVSTAQPCPAPRAAFTSAFKYLSGNLSLRKTAEPRTPPTPTPMHTRPLPRPSASEGAPAPASPPSHLGSVPGLL